MKSTISLLLMLLTATSVLTALFWLTIIPRTQQISSDISTIKLQSLVANQLKRILKAHGSEEQSLQESFTNLKQMFNKVVPVDLLSTPLAFNKTTSAQHLKQLDEYLDGICTNKQHLLCNPMRTMPWVILGTAGTGTRVVNNLLEGAGVLMSQITNKQKDSKIFIEWLKKHPKFAPSIHIPEKVVNVSDSAAFDIQKDEEASLMSWLVKRRSFSYNVDDVSYEIKGPLLDALERVHRLLALEIFMRNDYENKAPWGFKEPQGIFILPLLDFFYKQLNRTANTRLKVVHVIRDGRDIAFSKQHLRKYQFFYASLLEEALPPLKQSMSTLLKQAVDAAFDPRSSLQAPEFSRTHYMKMANNLPLVWKHRIRVIRMWETINLFVKRYAQHNDIDYIQVKLEDLCQKDEFRIQSFFNQLNLPDDAFKRVNTTTLLDPSRCNVGKFAKDDPVLAYLIQNVAEEGLLAFNYSLLKAQSQRHSTDLLQAKTSFNKLLEILPQRANKQLFVTVVTRKYVKLFRNWLSFVEENVNHPPDVLVLTSDPKFNESLVLQNATKANVIPFLVQDAGFEAHSNFEFGHYDLWRIRLAAVRELLDAGWVLFLSDLDVLFVADPFQSVPSFDIVATRGRFPYDLGNKWGATACMGAILLRPTEWARSFIKDVYLSLQIYPDDQIALNRVLDARLGLNSLETWNQTLHFDQRFAILPFESVPRFCKDDFKATYPDKREPSSANWFRELYPEAFALHCYTPKESSKKEEWWRQWFLWKKH